MRTYALTLYQNTGDGIPGTSLDLSSKIQDLGAIRWEADEQLTKLSPGDFSCRVLDYDGAVLAWLQTSAPSTGALYPPFLTLDVDGTRAFTGLVSLDKATRDAASGILSLSAQDWSTMLAANALDTWARPLPLVTSSRPSPGAKTPATANALLCAILGLRDVAFFDEPMNWAVVGDLVDITTPNGNFSGVKVVQVVHGEAAPSLCGVHFDRAIWPVGPSNPFSYYSGTFTRRDSTKDQRGYYLVTAAIGSDGSNEVALDMVDGIVCGDRMQLINADRAQSWTALQVDAAGKKVITREKVTNLAINDRVFFTDDCLEEVVFEDMRAAVKRAVAPFYADFSRYTPPTLATPVLVWLPLRPLVGEDLTSVRDMDHGTSSLRVFGTGTAAWDGTPETGWATASGALPRAYWSDQTTTPPSSLMPDETTTAHPTAATPLSPGTPRRYRPVPVFRQRTADQEDTDNGTTPGVWGPTTVPKVVLYDYLNMRRIQIAGRAVIINAWTGSAWGTATNVTWPDAATVKAACVLPGGPAGMVLGLTSNGVVGAALPGLSPQTAVLVAPAAAADAVLKTTPWGAYLVGSRGYGKITYSAGSLSLAWCDLIQPGAGALYPNTFAAVDANNVMVCARFDSLDSAGKTVTETHLLLLQPTPTTADVSVIWDEKLLDGAPITLGAFRDPTQTGRAIGHCGGRIFQVSAQFPAAYALERFTPSKMTSAELLEHICQVIQAVAVPTPTGMMQIVSRSQSASPQALTVDQVELQDTRTWEHFYSLVRVTGATEGLLYDATGPTNGGKLLEVSNHPLIWSTSGCAAMALSLAAWFGVPRRHQTQRWFWTDPSSAAPWEALAPLTKLNVNGDSVARILLSLEYRPDKGEATATLVEA